jgi:archaellum biogenesis ATPase FlaH
MSLTGATGPAPIGTETGSLFAAMNTARADRVRVDAHLEKTATAGPDKRNNTLKASRPIAIKPEFDAFPADLKPLPNWVCWRYSSPKSDGKKPRKIPFQPDGHAADTTDPSTWSTFEACRAAYLRGGFDGIGFVFDGAVGPDGLCYCGVDVDDCIGRDKKIQSIARNRIKRLGTYTEISPSGAGLHCIARAKPLERLVKFDGVEVYSTGRYFTFTGACILGKEIKAAPAEVAALVNEVRANEAAAKQASRDCSFTDTPHNFHIPKNFKGPAAAFASLDAAADSLADGIRSTHWFDSLLPNAKDEIVDLALAVIARNTPLLELEANGGNNAEWYKLTTAVARSGAPNAENIFVKYASGAKDSDPEDELRKHFTRCCNNQSLGQHGITVATLLHVAHQNGANFDKWRGHENTGSAFADSDPAADATSNGPLSMRELLQGSFPRPEFLIENLVLAGNVNLLYGDGGTGKTLLALHMAVALAANKPLFGLATKQTDVLLVLAEDGYGVTKDRLKAICEHFEIDRPEDLPIEIWCLPAHDISLASVTDAGEVMPRPFYADLTKRLEAEAGQFVVLDSLADIAILNEEKRLAVNAFMKRSLGSLCKEYGATVLVLGHPSKTSMNDGTMYSGSTAFNNAVRSRITLKAQDIRNS